MDKDLRNIALNNFQLGLLDNVILPLLKENVKLQLDAGAEIVMIFDSTAHQLAKEDLNFYLDKTLNSLAKDFTKYLSFIILKGKLHRIAHF